MPVPWYPIGTLGQKWSASERVAWFQNINKIKREYKIDVLERLDAIKETLPSTYVVVKYGNLKYNPDRYPLFGIRPKTIDPKKPGVLITGGVHGYETSGVKGALLFIETQLKKFSEYFNIVVLPCISPWSYEVINRWTPIAEDPNRSFIENSPVEECSLAMGFIQSVGTIYKVHIDLHETTDTDESEFSPALSSRDGCNSHEKGIIPDGFYLVGGEEEPTLEWHKAMINGVRGTTHIAPPDEKGRIIGINIADEGIILLPGRKLGLCAGHLNLKFSTTTEVYPDSDKANDDICNAAQVACVVSGLQYIIENELK
eukprot:Tbor_TRINITY_DN5010_c6_g3::TRINITY_DN5010_c6_g3_i1::g.14119::m.14119